MPKKNETANGGGAIAGPGVTFSPSEETAMRSPSRQLQRRHSHVFAAELGTTTYLETLMHILKGNVGSGVFAMGDAVKHGGLLLAPALTMLMGLLCVHSQHILVSKEAAFCAVLSVF